MEHLESRQMQSWHARETEVFGLDIARQLLLVAVAIEGLAVLAFVPRIIPSEPTAVLIVTGVRTLLLVVLAVLIRDFPLRAVFRPVLVWSVLTVPPLVWGFALEARLGLPWVALIAPTVYALAVHGLARLPGWTRWAWVIPPLALIASGLLPAMFNAFTSQIEPVFPLWLAACAILVLVTLPHALKEPSR